MKKKLLIVMTALLVMTMVLMTSCGKSEFGMTDTDDKHMSLVAERAAKDDYFVTGSLSVEDGDEIVVDSSLESGSIEFSFMGSESEQSIDELPETDEEPAAVVTVSGVDKQSCQVPAGDYMVKVTCIEKATGTVEINVQSNEAEQWSTAGSDEEAGEAAGVGSFSVDPAGTSLGEAGAPEFRYMEGVAEARYGIAAVDLIVRKGLASIDEGDISFDNKEYALQWTETIGDTEVKCFGNREGAATKTVWREGDYSYAVLAYGAGGDDDFGLSADDLKIIVSQIK